MWHRLLPSWWSLGRLVYDGMEGDAIIETAKVRARVDGRAKGKACEIVLKRKDGDKDPSQGIRGEMASD